MKKMTSIIVAGLLLAGCQWSQFQGENRQEQKPDSTSESSSIKEKSAERKNQKDSELILDAAYFNEVNGKQEIMNASNTMALVNKTFALPSDYVPDDLIRPKVDFSFGNQDIEKSYLRKEAADALEKMFKAAKNEGILLYASSGYRSYDRQNGVFQAEVNKSGETKAAQAVAVPGTSEHQTGLAMDITSESVQHLLVQEFENTSEGKWLKDNAHRFGYILRYPKGKEDVTGYQFEPWHFRYVGEKAAKIIYERNWTLEEYFDNVAKI
ncbi:peptidase M15B and M15C DD-carboxypeptidase VanY/endolysin [Bacillus freudenreichii]|nr:peptidase M15B and M15C DD-carboxypeptidase VanY/endolysin [Bacillus freudenreichii]